MTDQPSSERPQFIEQWRAESRGIPYRPAKQKKNEAPQPPNPADGRYLLRFTRATAG